MLSSTQSPFLRAAIPILCGCAGALLLIISPLSHQAFCAPTRIIVSPSAAPQVLPPTLGDNL